MKPKIIIWTSGATAGWHNEGDVIWLKTTFSLNFNWFYSSKRQPESDDWERLFPVWRAVVYI